MRNTRGSSLIVALITTVILLSSLLALLPSLRTIQAYSGRASARLVAATLAEGGVNTALYGLRTNPSRALTFDGTNDLVRIGDVAPLNSTGTSLTVEAWVKGEIQDPYSYIFQKTDNGGTTGYGLYTGGTSELYFFVGTGAIQITDRFAFTWDNAWHHVAGVYNGATLKVFVDGVEKTSKAATGSVVSATGNIAAIGNHSSNDTYAFKGQIDEVRVSSSVRYTTPFTPAPRFTTDATTLGLWHFDEGTGLTTADSSANNLTGTLQDGYSGSGTVPVWTNGVGSPYAGETYIENTSTATAIGKVEVTATVEGDGNRSIVSKATLPATGPAQFCREIRVKTTSLDVIIARTYREKDCN